MTTIAMTTIAMMTIAIMTMTRHQRTTTKARGGSADKVWAVGLAGATCVGLVGVVGARSVEEAVAATPVQDEATLVLSSTSLTQPVSSTGLTEEQLDEYARALDVERTRLEAYHAELLDVAAALQESADSLAQASSAVPASGTSKGKATSEAKTASQPQPVGQPQPPEQPVAQPKPVIKPAPASKPAPQQAPQASTKGS